MLQNQIFLIYFFFQFFFQHKTEKIETYLEMHFNTQKIKRKKKIKQPSFGINGAQHRK